MAQQVEIAADSACELGEGVVWSARSRQVQWTDIVGKAFWSLDPANGGARKIDLPDRLGCFADLGGGRLIAAFAGSLERYDLGSGAREAIATIEADRPTTRINDGKLDRQGRLVFGTMDEAPGERPLGQVWSYARGQAPQVLFDGVHIANSIAFSPDGRRMYFGDSPTRTIWRFDYDPDEGRASNRQVFVRLSGAGVPDGSTVDAEGCLWNAEWDAGRIVRYTPDGRLDRQIALPCSRPTCCAFGGDGYATLFVTSARVGLGEAELAAQPHAGATFALDVGVRGLPDTPFPL